jgi:hypothetical protein
MRIVVVSDSHLCMRLNPWDDPVTMSIANRNNDLSRSLFRPTITRLAVPGGNNRRHPRSRIAAFGPEES